MPFQKGYKPTKEHRMNLSKASKGRKKSEEHKRNISLAKIGFIKELVDFFWDVEFQLGELISNL